MDLHLSQMDVAKLFNTCEDTITGWENGRNQPQTHFYPRIIDFLGYIPFEVSNETLGGVLKSFRLTRGLSQKSMGKLFSVSESTVASWENEQTTPNMVMKEKILLLLEREPDI